MLTDVTSKEQGLGGRRTKVSLAKSDVRATLDAFLRLANDLSAGIVDVRSVLVEARFDRAADASEASIRRIGSKMDELLPFLVDLPGLDVDSACGRVNEELVELPISPSLVAHDGWSHHMHWTSLTARFDDQVMAEFLMAVANELVENGTVRFGRCGAVDCSALFYDDTRNSSRRFCSGNGCASRTHTALHRARARNESKKG